MKNIANNISELIGDTPIIKLKSYDNIYAKCEFLNPTGSIKDRAAFGMLQNALQNGTINKNTHIIEPTSGNTGIALAAICASLGLKLTIIMPESMSIERRKLIQIFGANVILTNSNLGMQGSIDKAKQICNQEPNNIILDQFSNNNNVMSHYQTALEIINDMGEDLDIFVTSVGTGGTLSGIAKELKKYNPNIKIVAIEPTKSAVLSGKKPQPHNIQGIGAGFVPKILDTKLIDQVVMVDDQDAIQTAKLLVQKEGLLVGISSGANVWGSQYVALKYPNCNILTILCDTAQRYLSTELFDFDSDLSIR